MVGYFSANDIKREPIMSPKYASLRQAKSGPACVQKSHAWGSKHDSGEAVTNGVGPDTGRAAALLPVPRFETSSSQSSF